jgi:hypothetical protein
VGFAFFALATSMIASIVCAYLTAYHHKPGVNMWLDFGLNPANAVLMPRLLTKTCLKYRKATFCLLILTVALFVACVVAMSFQ